MLNVLSYGQNIPAPCALVLGGFDGFHIGHAALVRSAKAVGLPVAVTLIAGGKAGGDLFTLAERELLLNRSGVSYALEMQFTDEFLNTSAEDFLNRIFRSVQAKAVFCGEDFRFGRGAEGDAALLEKRAPCPVTVLPFVTAEGEKVSSTTIKRFLKAGEPDRANALLEGEYFILGSVEHGRGVGRGIGFPTLNLNYPAEKFPLREGVYGGHVQTPQGDFQSIVHFGMRPTFDNAERKIEAYLKDFSGDLYGAKVCVFPQKFFRPIRKFESGAALARQLQEDKERLKEL